MDKLERLIRIMSDNPNPSAHEKQDTFAGYKLWDAHRRM